MAACGTETSRALSCRDGQGTAVLKLISIFVIFFTSVLGISSPTLLARLFHGKPVYDKAILAIKCFAAGVILSTSLVHVLPDAISALADCQVASRHPWKDFPFSGLVALIGVLAALFVELTATSDADIHNHGNIDKGKSNYEAIGSEELEAARKKSAEAEESEEERIRMKQRIVSQVLEIGIIFHSVIIGVTMGMSQNRCTIRPLVAALAFHQIFEGMGLGGCIAQAGFSFGTTAYMWFMFAVTTPMGIVLGMIIFWLTGYDDNNPNALILEGLLGSLSAGILIYMALVDLLALDFFHNRLMNSELWLKKACFAALALGSTAMSILALWA